MDTRARFRAYICCGPNCTAQRSPALIDVLQREVDRAGLGADVEVLPGGCMKHCERGPSLAIWPGPIYYELVDAGRLRRIVRDHLAADRPIPEWFYHEVVARREARSAAAPGRPGPAIPTPGPLPARPPAGPSRGPVAPPKPPPRRPPKPEVDDFKW